MLYRFGDYQVDVTARQVDRRGAPVALEPRPFDLLVHLIQERRRVVSKEELQERLWPKLPVPGPALGQAVMKLRRAVSDSGGGEIIRMVPRVGYRFVAPLSENVDTPSGANGVADGLTIALLPVQNATGDASLAWLELGLMALAVRNLDGHPAVVPVSIPSMMMVLQGARAVGDTLIDAALRRATGARIVVHSRVVRGRGGVLRLVYKTRGEESFRGAVESERPTDLAARFADALVQALHPSSTQPQHGVTHDLLSDEAFARGVQALTAHRWAKAANLLQLALDLEPDRTDAQLELLRALGNLADKSLLPIAHRLLAHAEHEQDAMLAARVHQALGRFHLNLSELTQADHHLALSLEYAAGQGGADWTARTLMLQATAAANRLDHLAARQIVGRMYEQCNRSGDRVLPVAGLGIEANATAASGNLQQAATLSLETVRRAREVGAHSYLIGACDDAAWHLAKLGRLVEAAAQAEESVAAALSYEILADAWRSMPALCWIYRLACLPEAARRAIERMSDPVDVTCPEHVWRARALLAVAEGRHAEAADDLARAVGVHRAQQHVYDEAQTLPWLVDALVRSGRLEEAEAELQAMTAPRLAGSADLKAQTLHGRASLAHARGGVEEAMTYLEQLVDTDAAAPLWRAWARIDLAWLEVEGGEIDAASRTLARVPQPLTDHPLVHAVRTRIRTPGAPCTPMQCLLTRR
jgi:DNA-binding winged helix-turn-helix (wHTH) protein/tetratricopeptide (TPR) repeat protein